MSFLEIFFSTCSGVKVFQKLKDYSLVKAVLHFMALAVVFAFFITFCRSYSVYMKVWKVLDAMTEEFGYIETLPHSGILPGKSPKRERTLELDDNLVVTYFPDKNINLNISSEDKCLGGIVWTPGFIAFWSKTVSMSDQFFYGSEWGGRILAFPIVRAKDTGIQWGVVGSASNVVDYLKKNYRPEGPFIVKKGKIEFKTFCVPVVVLLLFRIFFVSLVWNILASGFLFIAIFMLMFSLMENKNLKVDFKRLYTIGLYAAFPAVFIASLFPAFDLPLFDYRTVFLFCFLAYILFVINSLRTYLNKDADEADKKMERL